MKNIKFELWLGMSLRCRVLTQTQSGRDWKKCCQEKWGEEGEIEKDNDDGYEDDDDGDGVGDGDYDEDDVSVEDGSWGGREVADSST